MQFPKPRKRIKDREYLRWLSYKPCLYCDNKSGPPHHIRYGEGPGKGSASRKPDDYRAIPCCPGCHNALHGTDKARLKWMTEKIGRAGIYLALLDNLIEFIYENKIA